MPFLWAFQCSLWSWKTLLELPVCSIPDRIPDSFMLPIFASDFIFDHKKQHWKLSVNRNRKKLFLLLLDCNRISRNNIFHTLQPLEQLFLGYGANGEWITKVRLEFKSLVNNLIKMFNLLHLHQDCLAVTDDIGVRSWCLLCSWVEP